ncbi:MAG: transglutaminase-like cysteine peptidase [Variibacter sp.]|nr:transglutaminase-like cysteine peptidase [Variibacter sp.]
MYRFVDKILAFGLVAFAAAGTAPALCAERVLFAAERQVTRPPVGWVEFCAENPGECAPDPAPGSDVAEDGRSWRELVRINKLVNDSVRPMTDLEHYGVVEKWSFPDDGYGDCEDYVLLKRQLLTEAGWPRSALLITVVRDQKGDGHAVLTVRTDKGDFILDNQESEIRLWSETPYRFVKRQSQNDPNVWVSLGDARPAVATATSR